MAGVATYHVLPLAECALEALGQYDVVETLETEDLLRARMEKTHGNRLV